jgi:DNA-binding XRE family transcriptional regulator
MTPHKLRSYRRKHDLTQKQLADRIGVNQSSVAKWELGTHPIPKWVGKMLSNREGR